MPEEQVHKFVTLDLPAQVIVDDSVNTDDEQE